VGLQFVPLAEEHLDAVRRFNRRMREARAATDFLLPEEISEVPERPISEIEREQIIALDGTEVHGGVLEMRQPGWLLGREVRAVNYQSPLSEGIIDRKSIRVAPQMVKFMERRSEAVFIVGMGDPENALPRLLKAAGWSVRPIPFLFRVHNAQRALRELGPLHNSRARHLLASAASATGIGAVALKLMQRSRIRLRANIRSESGWGTWADTIWQQVRGQYSFAVERNSQTLQSLYPSDDSRLHIFTIRREQEPVGWAVCMETKMKNNRYFGNLRVSAILDCAAIPQAMTETAVLADREMASRGADLLFVNHSYAAWVRAFRSAGFLPGPSNYQLGMSKTMTEAICGQPGGEQFIHVTRGDGDGRCNF
jgi:hypothetical protein